MLSSRDEIGLVTVLAGGGDARVVAVEAGVEGMKVDGSESGLVMKPPAGEAVMVVEWTLVMMTRT